MAPHPPARSFIDPVVLGRFLDGSALPEERAAVERWVGGDAERRDALEALRAAWEVEAERLGAPYDVDAAWARVTRRRWPSRVRPKFLTLAAGIVITVLATGSVWWLARASRSVVQAPAMREYVTPRGRRAVFRLLDGTEITLNADSRLRAPAALGEGDRPRDVYLEGEAYFRVIHDATRPFVVHTAGGAIQDIGTTFSVRAYGDVARERVAVVEGAVALAGTSLRAGQVATRLRTGTVRVLRGAKVADEVAWTRGRLVFTSVPLGEVAQALSRWYDLDIQVVDPGLASRPVTGSYGDEPVTQVLTLITAAVGARYEWQGRSVTISSLPGAR